MTQKQTLKDRYRNKRDKEKSDRRKRNNNVNENNENQQMVVDNALSSIYGPISEYVDSESLYDVFASTYGSGRTEKERDLTGFDPYDWASEKLGVTTTSGQRNLAIRGARKKEGLVHPEYYGSGGYGLPLAQSTYTGERIPGYDDFREYMSKGDAVTGKGGRDANAFDDYFYDLAFQDELRSRVLLGTEAQGRKGYLGKKAITPTIEGHMKELEILIPDKKSRELQLSDIKKQASIQAKKWSSQYKDYVITKIDPALEAVEQRQGVLNYESDVADLNRVIRKKKELDGTMDALNKVSPVHLTDIAGKIVEKVGQSILGVSDAVYEGSKGFLHHVAHPKPMTAKRKTSGEKLNSIERLDERLLKSLGR
jgi:hypothetical protein|tara:strand:+ start:1744 stop:2844 length:1101 start_codon:yes stop_codon:yes gene_type:complete